MARKRVKKFSVEKAVKANARERVGQPKASRVVEDTPRVGRRAKYKPKLEDILEKDQ